MGDANPALDDLGRKNWDWNRIHALFPQRFDDAGSRNTRDVLPAQVFRMNANRQHFFVVAAVENSDASTLGQGGGAVPEKIVIQFVHRRFLKRHNIAACRAMACR